MPGGYRYPPLPVRKNTSRQVVIFDRNFKNMNIPNKNSWESATRYFPYVENKNGTKTYRRNAPLKRENIKFKIYNLQNPKNKKILSNMYNKYRNNKRYAIYFEKFNKNMAGLTIVKAMKPFISKLKLRSTRTPNNPLWKAYVPLQIKGYTKNRNNNAAFSRLSTA